MQRRATAEAAPLNAKTPAAAIRARIEDIPDAEARTIALRIREAAKRPEPRAVFEADVPLTAGGKSLIKHPDFEAAKAGDLAAARRLAPELVSDDLVARITASLGDLSGDQPLVLAFARRQGADGGGNAIPEALAELLSERLGGRAVRFVQAGEKMRGRGAAERVMSEAGFDGPVEAGARYLLVDDYLTLGSTMQNLRSSIEAKGGNVAGVATLGKSRFTASFAPSPERLAALRAKFPGLEGDWQELTGAPLDALTDAEARYLSNFADEGALKERVLGVATKRAVAREGPLAPGAATPAPPARSWRPPAADTVRAASPESELFVTTPSGRRFLKGPDGSPRLGTVPHFEGAPHDAGDIDVRLLRGTIKHLDTPMKRSEARAAGYADGLDLTTDVAENFTEVRRAHDGRLMLVKPNGDARVVIAELEKDEDGFYRIVTSGFRDLGKPDAGDVLWRKVRDPSASAAGQPSPLLASPLDAGAAQQATSGQSTATSIQPGRVEINWARIEGPDDIKLAMQQMADARAGEIDAARRGVRGHAETVAEAGRTDAWSVLMERRAAGEGAPLNAEQSLAARQLWASSAEKLTDVAARAAANPSEANIFAFRKMLATHHAIQQEVIAARTETARALNAWKIPAGATGEKMRAIEEALRETGGADFHRELAQRLAAFQGNEAAMARQLDEVVRGTIYTRTRDAMLQAWINGLLSGPQTHLVNMMSNTAVAFNSALERAAAARISQAVGTEGGVQLGEATAQMFGLIEGLKDALRIGGAGRRMGTVWKNIATGESAAAGSKIDVTRQGRAAPISSAAWGVAQDSGVGKAIDLLGTVVDAPSRALGAEDELFKTIGYRMELNAQALRRASAEVQAGTVAKADLKTRIAEIVADPPEDIRLAALDQAALQTFTNPLGAPGQAALKLVNTAWPLRVVVPFVRTPANIFRYVTERTPLAPLVGQWRADIAAGGARRDLAMARTALGSMILLAGIDMARTGNVTGRAPSEPGAREHFLRTKQAYSVKIGGRWQAYNRLDPLGMTLGIAADLAQTFDSADFDADFEDDATRAVASAAAALASNVTSKTYLSGLSALMEAMALPDAYAEGYVARLAGSLVPTGVAQVRRAEDPYLRYVSGLSDALAARVPGISDSLPVRRDVWGRPISQESGLGPAYDLVSPIYSRKPEIEPIDRELENLGWFPTTPPKRVSFDGVSVNLANRGEIWGRYVELAGNELKNPAWNLGLKDFLNAIVEDRHPLGAYYRMLSDGPDGGKRDFIAEQIQDYRAQARTQLLAEFPALASEVARRRGEKPGKFAQQ